MRYPRVTVIPLSDNSFFICVPLIDKEMEHFERRLSAVYRRRGEKVRKSIQDDMPSQTLTVFTALSKEEAEKISNNIVRKILRASKKRGQG